MVKTLLTSSSKETEAAGADLARLLKAGDTVAFFGGLGAGKTTFIRGLAGQICPEARVQSPTFAIMLEYAGKTPIYHFDMYRIKDADELYATGFFDFAGKRGITLIEWSENIKDELPENCYRVRIGRTKEENQRIIEIEKGDGR